MKPPDLKDAVIIGGGISGLAAAHRLQKQDFDVLLLEKSPRLGGSILTEQVDAFLIDCGPNSTLDTSPVIRDFIDELGLQDSRLNANASANRRYILRNGALQALPMSPPQFLASELFSWRAKLRLLAEPFIAPAPQDTEETIAEFVTRRLGREFLDYAINPFVAGVYAGDPEKLSVQSAVAKIYALEKNYGSLIKGAIKGARERKKRAETDKTKAQLFSFRHGMQELTARLAEHLGANAQTGCSVEQVLALGKPDGRYEIRFTKSGATRSVYTKSVIFTTPAFVTSQWLKSMDTDVARCLDAITYPPVAMVFLGFKRTSACRPLDGFGFLVPQVEGRRILGNIWSSTIFQHRAPAGGAALTTFVGGMRQPEITEYDDAKLTETVLSELRDILNLQGQPDVVRIKRWHKAIPQYELGHHRKVAAFERFESNHPGLFLSGNYRKGISVGDCIVYSKEVCHTVSDYLKMPRDTASDQIKKPVVTN